MTEKDTPTELVSAAFDHTDRAQSLREEAEKSLKREVMTRIDYPATVHVEYDGSDDTFTIKIMPETLESLGVDDLDDVVGDRAVSVEPTIVTVGKDIALELERVETLKELIAAIADTNSDGAPLSEILARVNQVGLSKTEAEKEMETLMRKGEIYTIKTNHYRTT